MLVAYGARSGDVRVGADGQTPSGLGYAVPGSVIAVGVLIPVTRLDHVLASAWQQLSGDHPGLLLTGGIAALVYAYVARFLSIALQTLDSGLARITPSMDDVARRLGCRPGGAFQAGPFPVAARQPADGCVAGVCGCDEGVTATLVMRPFNFDTLATQTYTLASDERLSEASTCGLAIVAVGLIPIILLARQISRGRAGMGTN